jgi:peptidoglycan/LPS O-acetylase OafA/YrhL
LVTEVEQLIARRLSSIDFLRGFAVLAVVAVHIPHDAPGGWRQNVWFFPSILMDFGYMGVPLFVIISGFCIHRRAAIKFRKTGACELNWFEFWKRRFWRLYPPYLAAMLLSVIAARFFHSTASLELGEPAYDLCAHLLLVHNLTEQYAGGMGNGAFWSLGMEEQLYMLYFLLLILFRKFWVAIGFVTATTIAWRLLVPYIGQLSIGSDAISLGAWGLWPFSFWMHWMLGAVAVDVYFGNRKLPAWTSSLCTFFGLLLVGMLANNVTVSLLKDSQIGTGIIELIDSRLLTASHHLGELLMAIGFFCLLRFVISREGTLFTENVIARFIRFIGRISYSVYLVHIPIIYVLSENLNFGSSGVDWFLRTAIFSTISIIGGWVFYQTVESRFLVGHLTDSQYRPGATPEK